MHYSLFFFTATATPQIYTLSLHDALPISRGEAADQKAAVVAAEHAVGRSCDCHFDIRERLLGRTVDDLPRDGADRKSTRLNSSHGYISYAVFCLKKKKKKTTRQHSTIQHV